MTDLSLRPAIPADLEMLIAMSHQKYADEGHPFDEANTRRAAPTFLADPTIGFIWFVEDAGQPIGYLAIAFGYSLEYGGRDAFLDEVYVHADYRNQGIGSWLIEQALDECRARDVQALHLQVFDHNPRARTLYERLGFVAHDSVMMSRLLGD